VNVSLSALSSSADTVPSSTISKLVEIVVPPSVVSLKEILKFYCYITVFESTVVSSALSNSATFFMLPSILSVSA
jgi:hypothetical protein